MKIGTDGVLLGAWCSLKESTKKILDVGSGTGVISLMLAQRFNNATIDSVELENNAHKQSVENFERSVWADRLFCFHSTFQDFANELKEDGQTYDLIISNPPFYTDNVKNNNRARNKARSTSFLSFVELISGVSKILSNQGEFTTIIPFKEEVKFIEISKQNKLFLNKICRVKGNNNSDIKRSLLTFSFYKKKLDENNLIIETSRHLYTDEYINLTKNFYIKM
jgi:tRNA1Val (adenine37-N6)-methyltransferase|tara:strand:+ start:208 stop:876 length:669 start_codon:yes stop_codon:yes gene_type:complete